MTPVLSLLPGPLIIAALALLAVRGRILSRLAALVMAGQCVAAAIEWFPRLGNPMDAPIERGFGTDSHGALFVLLTTLVVTAAFVHAVSFFDREAQSEHPPVSRQIGQFYFFAPLFLIAMYAVVLADNLGYMWIGMEATTLLSAPLVYFHRSARSLEATWKYVIICSVGIAFGFFGTAVLFAASQQSGALAQGSLSLSALTAHASQLPPGMVRLAFVFLLLGYGTKAGLFPLHNWLPDAHSEAPAPASAILSGSLLNCALVALWRISDLARAAGQDLVVRETLLPMAVATVIAAALFLLRQKDVKRMLAYSSMENVGIMATAIGLGTWNGFALQAINHSLCKVAVFLLAGNLLQQFGTKNIHELRGLLRAQPGRTMLLLLAITAVAGTPPFGSFLAEWRILSVAADGGLFWVVAALAASLALAFIALAMQSLEMALGAPPEAAETCTRTKFALSLVLVPAVLLLGSLILGTMLPASLLALVGGLR
ncbi:MAG: proton-conducting transporter membrane subunit [Capsulimonadaceae bacterium]|nr:proton-conducting transporter membrane subunit [Capsulimonadaceae bacterium]